MKIKVLVRKLLGVSVATRSRCGFLIALVLVITIGVREAVRNIGILNRNEAVVCIVVGAIGFVAWLAGRIREYQLAEAADDTATDGAPPPPEDPLGFLHSAKYWGLIIMLSASILSVLAICRRPKPVLEVHAHQRPVTRVVITNIVTITNEARKIAFPALELQGLVVNGNRSAAVINGRVLQLGEEISNAVLVAVDSGHAAVAVEGQTNVLALRK